VVGDILTPFKNQGSCGSCWAHAGVETYETAGVRAGKWTGGPTGARFSAQQLVDCARAAGCNGGSLDAALRMYQTTAGISEDAYPYQGVNGVCKLVNSTDLLSPPASTQTVPGIPLASFGFVDPSGSLRERKCEPSPTQMCPDENLLLASLEKYGPMVVGVSAANWQNYNVSACKGWVKVWRLEETCLNRCCCVCRAESSRALTVPADRIMPCSSLDTVARLIPRGWSRSTGSSAIVGAQDGEKRSVRWAELHLQPHSKPPSRFCSCYYSLGLHPSVGIHWNRVQHVDAPNLLCQSLRRRTVTRSMERRSPQMWTRSLASSVSPLFDDGHDRQRRQHCVQACRDCKR
jgi:hypothetical protein